MKISNENEDSKGSKFIKLKRKKLKLFKGKLKKK